MAILATGEELVDLGDTPDVGQIFNSNSYALAAQVLEAGGEPVLLGIARDNAEDLTRHINDGLAADLLITSGGVSVGDFDLVKSTLGGLGNDMRFWRVRMKPGKPMAFGVLSGKPVFGLPGNPVSTMVSFELFVRPSLLKMQGHKRLFRTAVEARLLHPLTKSPERRHYVRSIVYRDGGEWAVRAIEAQGSNILHSMVRANGLVVFPEHETELAAGSRVQVILLGETPSEKPEHLEAASLERRPLLNQLLPDQRPPFGVSWMNPDKTAKLPFSAAILAGGKSRRMGRNKSMLEIGGVPVIRRIADTLDDIFSEVLIIANEKAEYEQMGFAVAGDIHPGNDSLGGLHTAVTIAARLARFRGGVRHAVAAARSHMRHGLPGG